MLVVDLNFLLGFIHKRFRLARKATIVDVVCKGRGNRLVHTIFTLLGSLCDCIDQSRNVTTPFLVITGGIVHRWICGRKYLGSVRHRSHNCGRLHRSALMTWTIGVPQTQHQGDDRSCGLGHVGEGNAVKGTNLYLLDLVRDSRYTVVYLCATEILCNYTYYVSMNFWSQIEIIDAVRSSACMSRCT